MGKIVKPNPNGGDESTFWKFVDKISSPGEWLWTGSKTTNHNTEPDKKRYYYGKFDLCSKETRFSAEPTIIHRSTAAHRICLFLIYGIELSDEYEVFSLYEKRLDINPDNLGVRHVATRQTWEPAAKFFSSLTAQAAE